ncbi:hypothetical protein [Actinoplanes regularis]|uniref:hypothetical protein n=1 Tax=Actinoplanes regularis TaxID=52697 RepID=UPI0025555D44|nr:hypothetical protein [Actinoplanes regularis]
METTHIEWFDSDGDGYHETTLLDADTDGYTDLQLTDLDQDGTADAVLGDVDADGTADFAYGTLVADQPAQPPFPAATTGPFPVPGVSSDTQALMDSLNSQMSDASTIYHSAIDPGSVSTGDVAAATGRIDNASRMTGALEGYVAAQEITNDVRADEIDRSAMESAQETATTTWIESERAANAADWAVWESEKAL